MRCLYCGKELALFKRLRGGEFCSDAHRQRYQEEYTQLALNRLLQANEAKEKEKEAKGEQEAEIESPALKRREKAGREENPSPAPASPLPASPKPAASPSPVTAAAPHTAVLESEPSPVSESSHRAESGSPPSSEPAPQIGVALEAVAVEAEEDAAEAAPAALAGFLIEVPLPLEAGTPAASDSSANLTAPPAPVLPRLRDLQPDLGATRLDSAGRITLSLFTVADFPTPLRERGLELREFVRGVPQVEIQVKPAVESGFEPVREALEVSLEPHPPSGSPTLWLAPEVDLAPHAGSEILLGELVRLDFALTDWAEPGTEIAPAAEPSLVEPSTAKPPAMASRVESAPIEPARQEAPPAVSLKPEPVRFEPVHINPVFVESIAGTEHFQEQSETAPVERAEPEAAAAAPLAPTITKPLPVTLHGLGPARGKPVQVFTSAAVRNGDLQIPRDTGLPLRPVMILGPALKPPSAEPAPEKASPAKSTPFLERPELRPEAKPRRADVRVLPLQVKEQPKPEPPKPAAPVKPESAKPAEPAKPAESKPAEARPFDHPKAAQPAKPAEPAKPTTPSKSGESPKPAGIRTAAQVSVAEKAAVPAAPAPMGQELDQLGLPKLSFGQKETFWSRLPIAVRLGGIAAVLALGIGGIVLTSRGSGSAKPAVAVSTEPVMEEEPALANTAGWEQDWFADRPGVKLNRHVDILRGSLTQRDYRLVFEGQIERGSLGWVFRAADKSFYVEKIQMITPGRDPVVALVRFAVINGQEQPRMQVPLPIQAHLDTTYKVRMDIIGDRFTTWVQDQKADQWNDSQLAVGGVGLYYENGESGKLRDTLNVIPLKRK